MSQLVDEASRSSDATPAQEGQLQAARPDRNVKRLGLRKDENSKCEIGYLRITRNALPHQRKLRELRKLSTRFRHCSAIGMY